MFRGRWRSNGSLAGDSVLNSLTWLRLVLRAEWGLPRVEGPKCTVRLFTDIRLYPIWSEGRDDTLRRLKRRTRRELASAVSTELLGPQARDCGEYPGPLIDNQTCRCLCRYSSITCLAQASGFRRMVLPQNVRTVQPRACRKFRFIASSSRVSGFAWTE